MPRTPQEVTDAELAILQILWDRDAVSIRRLTDQLYPDGGTSAYATVQKLLERLETKGCVKRDRSETVHQFRANICRDELIGRRLRNMAEKLCGGSLTPLLAHLVKAEKLSASQRRELRDLIDQLDEPKKNERRK